MPRRRGSEPAEAVSRSDIVAGLAGRPGSSRLDLARSLGLGAATVTAQVRRLIDLGYVRELPAVVAGAGRPKVPLELVPDAGTILGVSVTVESLIMVATGLDGGIVCQAKLPFDPATPGAVDAIADACRQMMASVTIPTLAVGLALSGVVDEATGRVAVSVVLGWRKLLLGDLLGEALEVPVYVENDLRALASRELFSADPSAPEDFLLVVCGWGVGMAVVRHRAVVAGTNGTSTEFGHVSVDPTGPPCRCGNRGCLQAYLGTGELLDNLSHQLGRRPEGLAEVVGLAHARGHLAHVGHLLGRALGGAATLLGISDVRLTGESLVAWEAMERPFWEGLGQTSTTLLNPATVALRPWDEVTIALGASSMALSRVLASRA